MKMYDFLTKAWNLKPCEIEPEDEQTITVASFGIYLREKGTLGNDESIYEYLNTPSKFIEPKLFEEFLAASVERLYTTQTALANWVILAAEMPPEIVERLFLENTTMDHRNNGVFVSAYLSIFKTPEEVALLNTTDKIVDDLQANWSRFLSRLVAHYYPA